MTTYILNRLLLFVPTMLLVSLLIFVLARAVPGDAIDSLLLQELGSGGASASSATMPLTKAEREKLRVSLGIDKPLYEQYLTWVWGAVRFDFGDSLFLRRTNTSLIMERLPRSMEIAVLAVVIGVAYGVTLGVISAVKQDTWIDYAARVLAIGGIAMPSFFVAVMAFFFLIRLFNWIPPIEYHTLAQNPLENIKQIIAPALVLGLGAGASISRLTRSQMLEVFREDYVRTARAKGLVENVIVIRHVLRNSLLPVVTATGLLLGALLAGTIIVETVYSIPGMGQAMLQAINQRDYPVIQTMVWVISFIYMTSNLAVDILYGWIDPRIRYR